MQFLLLCYLLAREYSTETVIAIIALNGFNGLVQAWFSVAKTYAISAALILVTFTMLSRPGWNNWTLLTAGISLGIACNIRALLAPLLPVLVLWMAFHSRQLGWLETIHRIVVLCIGFVLSSLYSLYLLVKDPDAFFFNNIGFQVISRSWKAPGLSKAAIQKMHVLRGLFTQPQISIIGLLFITSVLLLRRTSEVKKHHRKRDEQLSFIFLATISLTSLLITPTYVQYFSICIPFAVLFCLPAIEYLLSLNLGATSQSLFVVVAVYSILSIPIVCKLSAACDGEPKWSIAQVNSVASEIQRVSEPSDYVLTWWPGYTFAAGRSIVPGMENNFGYETQLIMPSKQARRYCMATTKEVEAMIEEQFAAVVVLGNWMRMGEERKQQIYELVGDYYVYHKKIGNADIYILPPDCQSSTSRTE